MAELLEGGADPNLPLSQAIGSALCAVVNTAYESKRTLASKIALVRKLLSVPVWASQIDGRPMGWATEIK